MSTRIRAANLVRLQIGIQYTNVLSTVENKAPGHWTFESIYATLNGQLLNRPANQAIVDTGTSVILLETAVVEEICNALGGHFSAADQGWIFPNNRNLNNYPNVTLPCGTANITLAEPDDFDLGLTGMSKFRVGAVPRSQVIAPEE
jgi:hypothetical protein